MHELLLWPAHGISFAFEIRFHMFLQKRRFAAQLRNKQLKIQNSIMRSATAITIETAQDKYMLTGIFLILSLMKSSQLLYQY